MHLNRSTPCISSLLFDRCETINNSAVKTESVAVLKQGQKVLQQIEEFGSVMTDYKFKYLNSYSYDTRFTGLLALTMLNGVWAFSRRSSKIIGVDQYGRAMRTVKISAFTYFLGGLMLTPEIYNPLMVSAPKTETV